MEIFAPSILEDNSKKNENVSDDFNLMYYNFLNFTPKRTIANYVGWRVIQASLYYFNEDIRSIVLAFEKSAFGKEDQEQRWKLCANIVADVTPVAVGSLYISQYFSKDDKKAAEEMVQNILEEYRKTIRSSDWMDEETKSKALNTTSRMLKFIGYHENLRRPEADNYYDDYERWPEDNFLEMGLSFKILATDREFSRLHLKRSEKVADWTK